jgi:hypothetical protein
MADKSFAAVSHIPHFFVCGDSHQALADTKRRANQGQAERIEQI